MTLNNVRIRNKLLMAFGSLLAILILVSTISALGLMSLSRDSKEIGDNRLPSVILSEKMEVAVLLVRLQEANHILQEDLSQLPQIEKTIQERKEAFNDLLTQYVPLISDDAERQEHKNVVSISQKYLSLSNELLVISRSGDKEKARAFFQGSMIDVRRELSAAIGKLASRNIDAVNNAVRQSVSSANSSTTTILIAGSIAAALSILAMLVMQNSLGKPLVQMTEAMQRLAANDVSVSIEGGERGDEVGAMAKAVQVFKDNAIAKEKLEAEQRIALEARERRTRQIEALIADFDKMAASIMQAVSNDSSTLNNTARQLASIASDTSNRVAASSSAASQTSSNVATVAMAAEELSSSIREISRQVSNSNTVARRAMEEAERTGVAMEKLSNSAQEVGQVVDLVTSIAAQTNLLALNATIEAARAGEAGKGFAVVASEVKGLANQTANATSQISERITAMQDMAKGAVEAIEAINETISQMNAISTAVASAVEQQNAATQEIARNVQEAARGTDDVTGNISAVAQSSVSLDSSAKNVLGAADSLSQQSQTLGNRIRQFLDGIRAA